MTSRICPRCNHNLKVVRSRGAELDVCETCGGVWMDVGEFDSALANRFRGVDLEFQFELLVESDPDGIPCPDGHGPMDVFPFETIELDRCASCRGIWIDGAERNHFANQPNNVDPEALVDCSGCDARAKPQNTIRRQGVFFCEACVIRGNYPAQVGDQPRAKHDTRELGKAIMESERERFNARALRDNLKSLNQPVSIMKSKTALVELMANAFANWRER